MSVAVKVDSVETLLRIPEGERRHEVIDGQLIEKAAPSARHGGVQSSAVSLLFPEFNRRSGGGPPGSPPGGWWFATEVEVYFDRHHVLRPDISGWRRERMERSPSHAGPVELRPDWVCEVLSPSNATNDTVRKLRAYHQFGVPHYWIVDPDAQSLLVYRWAADGYMAVVAAEAGERVRCEPFDAVEFDVSVLFGDDPPSPP